MKNLNKYIEEAWSGVKQQVSKAEIEAWCDEMGTIENYTVNSKGEIDVDGDVMLVATTLKELPYKFGIVKGMFDIGHNKNLISLKNCPNEVKGYFNCESCSQLDSLEGCPKEVSSDFWCGKCKGKFTKKDVSSLCKAKGNIVV